MDPSGRFQPAHLIVKDWPTFRDQIRRELEPLKNIVGLEQVVEKLQDSLPADSSPAADLQAAEPKITQTIQTELDTVVKWLDRFLALVQNALAAGPPPGRIMSDASRAKSETWRKAFLKGMQDVLTEIRSIYTAAKSADFAGFAETIEQAGAAWAKSARNTMGFLSKLTEWAEGEMHRQLALHSVPSRLSFDPAQLAFCLRIRHDLAPDRDEEMLGAALGVLSQAQLPNGTWPVAAALATQADTGASIYPIALELIDAVLPLLESHGGLRKHGDIAHGVFRWLKANRRDAKTAQGAVRGWAGDYIWERGRIDVWATGLALQFLVQYRKLILDAMVREMKEAGYDTQRPDTIKTGFLEIVDPALHQLPERRLTTILLRDYVEPFRREGASTNSSMVLYGPPGTSKTTLAQAIAKDLNWSLITITPSDFVKNGIEGSEDMARTVFQDLLTLRDVVVLFDECDEMFRSRDGGPAPGMLQFIVPGMLPKLQRLKQYGEKNRLIFIIGTNYFERLDRAIIRPGRVDQYLLVPPYDRKSRICLIHDFLKREGQGTGKALDEARRLKAAEVLAHWTAGWVYPEIKRLIQRFAAHPGSGDLDTTDLPKIEDFLRTILQVSDEDPEKGHTFQFASPALSRGIWPKHLYDNRPDAKDEENYVRAICAGTEKDPV